MLRSLMTAVMGVRAHQTMLDVTGNNIANANTTGFKKDFTIFEDLMYQAQKNATGPGDGMGGINPAQVGLGTQVGAIETIFTQGAASYTGNPSDMMIQGKGFFVYNGGGSNLYSRAGAIIQDKNQDFVQAGTGYKLQGYAMERDPLSPTRFVQANNLSTVNVPIGKKLDPRATSEVKYQCNLDSRSSAYLPYGFPDLPYNEKCGWPGNPSGKAKIKMDGVEYDMSFKTNLASADGKGYLTVTVENGGTKQELVFDMVGIDGGKPKLAAGTHVPAAPVFPGTNPPVAMTLDYDDTTGGLKIKNPSGATVFEYNLKADMRYASFTLKNGADATPVIAEFDESPSKLSGTPVTLRMWYPNAGGAGMVPLTATVHFKPDGKFDFVEKITGTFPAGFTADNLKIAVVSNGAGLAVQQAKDLADPKEPFDTLTQINQGGYHQTKQMIFDCKGNEYTLEVNFKKLTENRWRWEAFLLDKDGKQVQSGPDCEDGTGSSSGNSSAIVPTPSSGEIAFCGCGPICDPLEQEIEIPFSLKGMTNSKIKLNFGGDGDKLKGVTQYASETTTKAVYQDGYKMGVLEGYSVGGDGTITGKYTNGQNLPMYRVALATFANEQGLEKAGDTMFQETVNSGNANIDAAGVNGKGSILSQNLEMSNVDLTEEFTHLIIAQRGFQANTRVVTVSDQILEEVVNLKR